MSKNNFYAVKVGRTPGIYTTWEECKKQVHGFKGAQYKGFSTKTEAISYMGISESDLPETAGNSEIPNYAIPRIYVDGSFDSDTGMYSYGMVVLLRGTEITDGKAFNNSEMAAMHNVAGEIEGAKAAMRFCYDNGISEVDLYYDYEGIAKWPLREWKANKSGTIAYVQYYDTIKKYVKVNFHKVKGHSGDRYNDMADGLAKSALGL